MKKIKHALIAALRPKEMQSDKTIRKENSLQESAGPQHAPAFPEHRSPAHGTNIVTADANPSREAEWIWC